MLSQEGNDRPQEGFVRSALVTVLEKLEHIPIDNGTIYPSFLQVFGQLKRRMSKVSLRQMVCERRNAEDVELEVI